MKRKKDYFKFYDKYFKIKMSDIYYSEKSAQILSIKFHLLKPFLIID